MRSETWHTLPSPLQATIADRLGMAVCSAIDQTGGFTPGLAARLRLADGRRFFVKAIPGGHPLAGAYRHEASTAARLPSGVPAPALRWHDMCAGWVILVFDDIEGCRPDLSPNAEDLLAVLAVLAAIAAPQLLPDLAPAPDARGSWLHGWAALAAHQPPDLEEWATLRLPELAVAEKAWAAHASGSALVHGDAITGYAAAYAGYWARMCRQPDPDGVPYLRAYQRRASAAALAWTIHRWQ